MAANKDVRVTLVGEDKASKTFGKVGGSADKLGSKLGAVFGGFLGGAAANIGKDFFKSGIEGMNAAQAASAQTAAVLKSMGNGAGKTQAEIEAMADSIEKMSGLEAENIQAGQNMLLTFSEIKGANFDRATMSMADMAARMGGDAVGAATMLGKALQDPAKGMSALTRVGVSFTDAQKQQITEMQAAGDAAGAQTIMLAALESQFGGSAKAAGSTLGGQMNILKARFGDVQEQVVAKLLPALIKFAEKLSELITWAQRNSDVLIPLVGVLGGFAAIIYTITAATRAYTAVQAALNTVMAANPIGLVVVAIAALAAGLVFAYQKSETFRNIVNGAFAKVLTGVDALLWGIQKMLEALGNIPGFGWADTAAEKIRGARDAVTGLRDRLGEIQSKAVTVTVNYQEVGRLTPVQSDRVTGRRAAGGPVSRNQPYLVGERGPEVIVPQQAGMVLPNNRLGGGPQEIVLVSQTVLDGTVIAESTRRIFTRDARNGRALGFA